MTDPKLYEELKREGKCPSHPLRDAIPGKILCEKCGIRSKKYYKKNRDNMRLIGAAYYVAHKEEIKARMSARYFELTSLEMVIVAQIHGDEVPRCRADLTSELLDTPCHGALQIDHINGGGNEEPWWIRVRGILDGTRGLDDLRVLCALHQARYAILRGDARGGSYPKDWEE